MHGDHTFHATATHSDAHGLPVALTEDNWPFHPTPCCGAAASISDADYGMYCKACYGQVDDLFGGVPTEPFAPVDPVAQVVAKDEGAFYRIEPHHLDEPLEGAAWRTWGEATRAAEEYATEHETSVPCVLEGDVKWSYAGEGHWLKQRSTA